MQFCEKPGGLHNSKLSGGFLWEALYFYVKKLYTSDVMCNDLHAIYGAPTLTVQRKLSWGSQEVTKEQASTLEREELRWVSKEKKNQNTFIISKAV